jgi:hypothetical protein
VLSRGLCIPPCTSATNQCKYNSSPFSYSSPAVFFYRLLVHAPTALHKATRGLTNTMSATVLGDIVERKPGASSSKNTTFSGSSKSTFVDVPSATGFPKAYHRSQGLSAFAARRARANEEHTQSSAVVPTVRASSTKDDNSEIGGRELAMPKLDAMKLSDSMAGVERDRTPEAVGNVAQQAAPTATPTVPTKATEGHNESEWQRNMERENDALIERMDDTQRSQEREELVEQLGPDVLDLINRIQGRRASAGKGLERVTDTGVSSRVYSLFLWR